MWRHKLIVHYEVTQLNIIIILKELYKIEATSIHTS